MHVDGRRVAVCLDVDGRDHVVTLRGAWELAWIRDNVVRLSDQIEIMYCSPVSPERNYFVPRWMREKLRSRARRVQKGNAGKRDGEAPARCNGDLYRRLFRSKHVCERTERMSLNALWQELQRGQYDIVVCSSGSLHCLQHTSTLSEDDGGSSQFHVPIVVLPKFPGDDALLIHQTCMSCGALDSCDMASRTCVRCLQAPSPSRKSVHSRKIAVGVSGSEDSLYAFSWAMYNIVRPGDTIVLIHVQTLATGSSCSSHPSRLLPSIYLPSDSPVRSPLPPGVLIDALEQQCIARGIHTIQVATEGEPGRQFVEWTTFHTCDLAVVGSRGLHSNLERLRKSVSKYTVKHAVVQGTGVLVVTERQRRRSLPGSPATTPQHVFPQTPPGPVPQLMPSAASRCLDLPSKRCRQIPGVDAMGKDSATAKERCFAGGDRIVCGGHVLRGGGSDSDESTTELSEIVGGGGECE